MIHLHSPLSPLLTYIRFGIYLKKSSYQAEQIFKDYYSRRLTLSHTEVFQFFNQLCQQPFNDQDHRWISLTQNLQKNVEKFKVENQVFMLKTLVDLQSKAALYDKTKQALMKRVQTLSFEETAILLWCVSKTFKKDQLNDLSIIYKRLLNILYPEKDDEIQPPIIVRKKQQENKEQQPQNIIKLSASSLSMVLSSMATLGISDKKIVKRLIQDGIKANLTNFSCTSLCTFLLAFQKLGLRNKRDTFQVYKAVRSHHKQLEKASIETLFNLAICVSNLSKRDLSDQEKKRLQLHPDELQKQKSQLEDMRVFFGWICQTILLREPSLPLSKAALILHYARKIQYFHKQIWMKSCQLISSNILDAKIVDLVMALKAITSLNKQNRQFLQKEEQVISDRLWQLQSSISGKSLHTLALMLKIKKIKPPPKILKVLNQHLISLETAKKTANTKEDENISQEKFSAKSTKG